MRLLSARHSGRIPHYRPRLQMGSLSRWRSARQQANQKIIEAANLAAAQMRKEAASLFSKAVKTSDIEKKEELLLDSHRLLSQIPVRFPQTELLDKVYQNISILEEQIRKIDPALLEELREEKQPRPDTWDDDPFSRQF